MALAMRVVTRGSLTVLMIWGLLSCGSPPSDAQFSAPSFLEPSFPAVPIPTPPVIDLHISADAPEEGTWSDPKPVGNWLVEWKRLPNSGWPDVIARTTGKPGGEHLVIRCEKGVTAIFILAYDVEFRPGGNSSQLLWYVDGADFDAIYSMIFRTGNKSDAIGIWYEKGAVPVIQTLLGGEYLRVMYGGKDAFRMIKTSFPIEGAEEAIDEIREACGWEFPVDENERLIKGGSTA